MQATKHVTQIVKDSRTPDWSAANNEGIDHAARESATIQ